MAQQKHNNLQILQAKNNNKPNLKPLHYILIGFISGIVCTAIVFSLYLNFGSDTQLSALPDQDKEEKVTDDLADHTAAPTEEEKAMTSVNEAELSGLFKPPANQANGKTNMATPFAGMSKNKTERPRNTEKPKAVVEKTKPVNTEKAAKAKEVVKPSTELKTDRPADRTPEPKPERVPEKKSEVSTKTAEDLPPQTIHAAIQRPLKLIG